MRALTPQQILELWADYVDAHPIDRTLALVSAAVSAEQAKALPDLPLGTRERWALGVRLGTFGSRWEGVVVCPECDASHEVVPPVALLLAGADPSAEPVSLRVGELELWVRAPSSRDQAEIAASTSTEQGVRVLLERCVSVRENHPAIAVADWSPEVVASVAELMSTLDPAAETWLELQCVACGAVWGALFDAGEFLWNEVAACAQRLLRQIHLLARAYGWRESDILSLGPVRREAYLELVLGA